MSCGCYWGGKYLKFTTHPRLRGAGKSTQFGVLKDKVMRLRINFMTEYHQGVRTFSPFLSDLP